MHKFSLLNASLIQQRFEQAPQLQDLRQAIARSERMLYLQGLVGSSLSFLTAALFKKENRPFFLILRDKEEAAYYLNDLEQLLPEVPVLFYPASYRRPYEIEKVDNANVLLRAEVLNRITTCPIRPTSKRASRGSRDECLGATDQLRSFVSA